MLAKLVHAGNLKHWGVDILFLPTIQYESLQLYIIWRFHMYDNVKLEGGLIQTFSDPGGFRCLLS